MLLWVLGDPLLESAGRSSSRVKRESLEGEETGGVTTTEGWAQEIT